MLRSVSLMTMLCTAAFAAQACHAADDPADEENQGRRRHNNMLYIKGEDSPAIFIPVKDHDDLGSASFSPDGKWIAFDCNTIGENPLRETWLVGSDGKGLRKLVGGATPRWFPDGKRFTFTRDSEGHANVHSISDVYEFTIATGKERKLCQGR